MATASGNDSSTLTVLRVFLASPSDLGEERRAARAAVDEINKTVARPAGFHVDLIGWEDTLSSAGRPQAIINEDLETCQMFIGMLWARWGTPPDTDGRFTSGFEEEFTLATKRHSATGEPHITLFFKDVEDSKLNDPGPELSKVMAFKNQVMAEKKLLFDTFAGPEDISQKIRLSIAGFIHRLRRVEIPKQGNLSQGPSTTEPVNTGDEPTPPVRSAAEVAFVSEFISVVGSPDEGALTAAQVARLRNLAVVFGRSGNDEISVGPHDANLVYLDRENFELSSRETSALADAGLEAWSAENKPLWSWLADRLRVFPGWLSYSTVTGPDARRIGALRVTAALQAPIVEDEIVGVSKLQRLWFGDTSDAVKNAALEYIAETDRPDLRALAEEELKHNNYATQKAALEAVIRSRGKMSSKEAALLAIQSSFDVLSSRAQSIVLHGMRELDDSTVLDALEHRSGAIRAAAIEILGPREKLTTQQMRRFFGDTSIHARCAAVAAYEATGESLSDEEAKEALVLKEVKSAFGGSNYDFDGHQALEQRKLRRLSRLPLRDLKDRATDDPLSADDYYFAMAIGHFSSVADTIRSDIDDRFDLFWKRYIEDVRRKFANSGADSLVDILQKNQVLRRRLFMRQALDIVISHAEGRDLPRLRRALDEDAADPRESDIAYFRRWGEWEDIGRISKIASDYRSSGRLATLLTATPDTSSAASAILKLAGDRVADIFELDISANLRPKIVSKLSMASVKRLPDSTVEKLLSDESDLLRKAMALQLLVSLSRRSARGYFARYLGLPYRYYNVIFWLDLAEAWGREKYRPIAERELRSLA